MSFRISVPARLPTFGEPVPHASGCPHGFVLLRKLPEEPWQLLNVLMDGKAPDASKNEDLRITQALVGGYVEAVGRITADWPYAFVCNEDGRVLGLPVNSGLLGHFGRGGLVGPVLFVKHRLRNGAWGYDPCPSPKKTTELVGALDAMVEMGSEGTHSLGSMPMLDLHLTSRTVADAAD